MSEPDKIQFNALTDTDRELLRRAGAAEKPPNTSIQLIMRRGETYFRVLCTECLSQFDVFGQMTAAPEGANEECSAVQRCLEHLNNCQLKTKIKETFVIQNKLTPEFFKLTVTWMP